MKQKRSYLFPLVLLQAKVVGPETLIIKPCSQKVSISSPSSEGGGSIIMWKFGKRETYLVSISSPSSEGGGFFIQTDVTRFFRRVSISSPSSEGGGLSKIKRKGHKMSVSISSPSSEGGGDC